MIDARNLKIGNTIIFCGKIHEVKLESFHGIRVDYFPYEPIYVRFPIKPFQYLHQMQTELPLTQDSKALL